MLRKHRTALIALAVANFVFFFPVLFMDRVVSPNDVFLNFSPWNMGKPLDVTGAQNSLMNDPPTAYYTFMALVREDLRATFHWNPTIGSGVPGFGTTAGGTLTPFSIHALFAPLTWFYTLMAFLKLNVAYLFAYLWLREERLGRRGAAMGALVFALAGVYTVRWLWQITNATALYPALLWVLRRSLRGRPTPILVVVLIAFSYGMSSFPAAIAYGAWITLAYGLYLVVAKFLGAAFLGVPRSSSGSSEAESLLSEESRRNAELRGTEELRGTPRPAATDELRGALWPFLSAALGVLIAALITLPMLVPFVQFIGRSGYLEIRKDVSLGAVFPLAHFESFIRPDRLGNPAYKNWTGNPALGVLNNYVETTVYLGLLTIPLALLGLFNRRARRRWFWLGVAVLILACMFGAPLIAPFFATLPGFKYSALSRLGLLLPLPVAYLVAAARLRRQLVYDAVAILIAFDLALFAGRFHPYLTQEQAQVAITPTIAYLQSQKAPFRIAPMMDYLWPNAAELVRLEDVRSHFSSEGAYRKMLQRIDPSSWSGQSTVITFFSPKYNFDDPLNALLGIRYFIEHKYIDIIKWGIFKATLPGVKETGTIRFKSGAAFERVIRIDAEPFWSIELPVEIDEGTGGLEVSLLKNGASVWSRTFLREEANVMNKVYIPLRPFARRGESVTLHVRANGVQGYLLQAENKSSIFYGRVTTPIMFERELPEGRIFRNLAELPRFRPVSRVRKMDEAQFLAARDVDFEHEAVITDDPVMLADLPPANARATLTRYASHEQRITTTSDAPFFLASSEKLTPELAVTIDGRPARPVETDLLFAGVTVPAGRHEVVFTRRVGRGWWWTAILGGVLLLVAIFVERKKRRA